MVTEFTPSVTSGALKFQNKFGNHKVVTPKSFQKHFHQSEDGKATKWHR